MKISLISAAVTLRFAVTSLAITTLLSSLPSTSVPLHREDYLRQQSDREGSAAVALERRSPQTLKLFGHIIDPAADQLAKSTQVSGSAAASSGRVSDAVSTKSSTAQLDHSLSSLPAAAQTQLMSPSTSSASSRRSSSSLHFDLNLDPSAPITPNKSNKRSRTGAISKKERVYKSSPDQLEWHRNYRAVREARMDLASKDAAVVERAKRRLEELADFVRVLDEKAASRARAQARNDRKRIEAQSSSKRARALKGIAAWRAKVAQPLPPDAIFMPSTEDELKAAHEVVNLATKDFTLPRAKQQSANARAPLNIAPSKGASTSRFTRHKPADVSIPATPRLFCETIEKP